jgi:hypothetical protein
MRFKKIKMTKEGKVQVEYEVRNEKSQGAEKNYR